MISLSIGIAKEMLLLLVVQTIQLGCGMQLTDNSWHLLMDMNSLYHAEDSLWMEI